MGRRVGAVLLIACVLVACTTRDAGSGRVRVPTSGAPEVGADEPILIDPAVRSGVLDNGLTYFVRENGQPGGRVSLRLVVDAGSAVETADQSGVAHFLEHMLFNGTDRFPGNELVDVLRGFGSEVGPDVNAGTTYDETVYRLTVPTEAADSLSTATDVMVDWLSAATLDAAEVEAERGVVLDEWRGGQLSAHGRTLDAVERLLLTGTMYEGRDPIGTETAISTMTSDVLRDFYDTWYRPDNAAVVIVGDVDVDEAERLIVERFSPLTARAAEPPRPDVAFRATHQRPRVEVHADADATDALVELVLPLPRAQRHTPASRRDALLDDLAYDLIATRLADDVVRGDGPLTSAIVDVYDLRGIDARSVAVRSEPEQVAAAVTTLLDEFERVRRFGFDAAELERAASSWRATVDSDRETATSTPDDVHADRLVEHFLAGTAVPDAETAWQLDTATLDAVGIDDVSARFDARWAASAPHLLVVGPADAALPEPSDLAAEAGALAGKELAPRPPTARSPDALMDAPDAVGEIAREQLVDEPGLFLEPVRLTFANGARVVINESDIVDGRVAFGASSKGGTWLVDVADAPDALLATQVVSVGGLGPLDAVDVERVLADQDVAVAPYLAEFEEGFSGEAASADVETAFQLLHLMMTVPTIDETSVEVVRAGHAAADRDIEADQELAAVAELRSAHYGDDPRARGEAVTSADVAALDVDGVRRVWDDRFGDAGDWVFAFSGDIDVEEVAELARRYIGTLPGDGVEEVPDGPSPRGVGAVVRERRAGTGERAQLLVLYSEPFTPSRALDVVLPDVIAAVLSNRLAERVREELGDSYSPVAFSGIEHDPDPVVQTFVVVTGAPDRMETIADVVQEMLADVRRGVPDGELSAALEIVRRDRELISNEEHVDALLASEVHGDSLDVYARRWELVDRVTMDDLVAFVGRVLPADRYVQVTVLPR